MIAAVLPKCEHVFYFGGTLSWCFQIIFLIGRIFSRSKFRRGGFYLSSIKINA